MGPRLSFGFGYPFLYIEVHVVIALGTPRGIVTKTPLTALNLIHTTVAAMVQCFDWKVGEEGDHAKVNMQVARSFTMPMAQPFICLPVVHFNPFVSSM